MEMKGAQRPRRPYPNAARQRRDENKPKFVDNNQLFIDQFVKYPEILSARTKNGSAITPILDIIN